MLPSNSSPWGFGHRNFGWVLVVLVTVTLKQNGQTGNDAPLRIVRLDKELPLPRRAHPTDAGIDLYTAQDVTIAPGHRELVGTGIAIALPVGTVGLVHPRSGLALKKGLSIVNAPGTIDADYRGEIKVCLINLDPEQPIELARGERIAQLLVCRKSACATSKRSRA